MSDLSQTLNDLLDEYDRLDAESTRVSDRVGERETPGGKRNKELREQSEIDLLYSDPQVIDFWKSEGRRYDYLYWVRAMIHRHVEAARIDPAGPRPLMIRCDWTGNGSASTGCWPSCWRTRPGSWP